MSISISQGEANNKNFTFVRPTPGRTTVVHTQQHTNQITVTMHFKTCCIERPGSYRPFPLPQSKSTNVLFVPMFPQSRGEKTHDRLCTDTVKWRSRSEVYKEEGR